MSTMKILDLEGYVTTAAPVRALPGRPCYSDIMDFAYHIRASLT